MHAPRVTLAVSPVPSVHLQSNETRSILTATGLSGLFVKARAAELAMKDDPTTECTDQGSFVGLSQPIVRDLKAIEAGMTDCPVAKLGMEAFEVIQTWNMIDEEADRKHWTEEEHLNDRREAIEAAASTQQASSALGALFQLALCESIVDGLGEPQDFTDKKQRTVTRNLYSARHVLESLVGVQAEQVAGDYYFTRWLDPYARAQSIMENWRTKQAARHDEAADEPVSDVQEAAMHPSGQIGDRLSNLEHVLDHAVGDLRELVKEIRPASGSKATADDKAA